MFPRSIAQRSINSRSQCGKLKKNHDRKSKPKMLHDFSISIISNPVSRNPSSLENPAENDQPMHPQSPCPLTAAIGRQSVVMLDSPRWHCTAIKAEEPNKPRKPQVCKLQKQPASVPISNAVFLHHFLVFDRANAAASTDGGAHFIRDKE